MGQLPEIPPTLPHMHPDARFNAKAPIEEKALTLIWRQSCNELKESIGDLAFDRWFVPLSLVRVTGEEVIISVPNSIYSLWVETNYKADLNRVLGTYLKNFGPMKFEVTGQGGEADVAAVRDAVGETVWEKPIEEISTQAPADLKAEIDKSKKKGKKNGAVKTGSGNDKSPQRHHECPDLERLRRLGASAGLNEAHLFENFVVSGTSRIAVAASEAVTTEPGKTYQPLFIHSGSGLGKTHLLHAIGWRTLLLRPKSKVVFLSAETFANEYVTALQANALAKFRNKYRKVDLLLIDDVQFLGNKGGMQEEFFHTFNSLNDSHKQIVMTSDMPPHEIRKLESRLVTRFQWGLTTEIAPPDEEARVAILRRKRDEWELKVSNEVIDFIASRIHHNVRLLEGALIRCSMVEKVSENGIQISELENVIADLQTVTDCPRLNPEEIQEVVAEEYGLAARELHGRRRTARIAEARHVAMLFSRELTDYSLVEIGEAFCRDHGTVIHGINSLRGKMEKSTSIRGTVEKLRRTLTRGGSERSGGSEALLR